MMSHTHVPKTNKGSGSNGWTSSNSISMVAGQTPNPGQVLPLFPMVGGQSKHCQHLSIKRDHHLSNVKLTHRLLPHCPEQFPNNFWICHVSQEMRSWVYSMLSIWYKNMESPPATTNRTSPTIGNYHAVGSNLPIDSNFITASS
jgi:hypothetical protein